MLVQDSSSGDPDHYIQFHGLPFNSWNKHKKIHEQLCGFSAVFFESLFIMDLIFHRLSFPLSYIPSRLTSSQVFHHDSAPSSATTQCLCCSLWGSFSGQKSYEIHGPLPVKEELAVSENTVLSFTLVLPQTRKNEESLDWHMKVWYWVSFRSPPFLILCQPPSLSVLLMTPETCPYFRGHVMLLCVASFRCIIKQ